MSKKIAVFGATGFVGQHLIKTAIDRGYSVTTIGRAADSNIKLDLSDFNKIISTKLRGYAAIIDVAAVNENQISIDLENSYDVNVTRSRAVVELAIRNGIKHISYCSTFHVYGKQSGEINHCIDISPRNDYGLTHFLSEVIYKSLGEENGISVNIVRPTNIYGLPVSMERFNRWSLIPFDFVRAALVDKKIHLKSSGFQQRNFVHIDNVVTLLLKFESQIKDAIGHHTFSIREFATYVSKVLSDNNLTIDVSWPDDNNQGTMSPLVFNDKSKYVIEGDVSLLYQFIIDFAEMYKECVIHG